MRGRAWVPRCRGGTGRQKPHAPCGTSPSPGRHTGLLSPRHRCGTRHSKKDSTQMQKGYTLNTRMGPGAGALLHGRHRTTESGEPAPMRLLLSYPRVPRPSACIRVKPCLLRREPLDAAREGTHRDARRQEPHAPIQTAAPSARGSGPCPIGVHRWFQILASPRAAPGCRRSWSSRQAEPHAPVPHGQPCIAGCGNAKADGLASTPGFHQPRPKPHAPIHAAAFSATPHAQRGNTPCPAGQHPTPSGQHPMPSGQVPDGAAHRLARSAYETMVRLARDRAA
jgi:hypothetical protein